MHHYLSALCLSLFLGSADLLAAEPATTEAGVVSLPPQLSITWLGGPTMLLEFNGFRLLTDPMLGSGQHAFIMGDPNEPFDLKHGPNIKEHARLTALPETDLSQLDLLLLSHAHEDHFDQQAQSQLDKGLPLLVPEHDLGALQAKGFTAAQSLAWQQSLEYQAGAGHIRITAVAAHHSADPAIDTLLGAGNGYWLEFSQGSWSKRLYWTGDTMPVGAVLTQVQTLADSRGMLDILVPHLGRVGTPGPLGQISMGASDVVDMARALQPEHLLPIHHSSYALYLEPISVLAEASAGEDYQLDLPQEGVTLHY